MEVLINAVFTIVHIVYLFLLSLSTSQCNVYAVCGFRSDGVRIVPGPHAPNGADSHLVQRFSLNSPDSKVLQHCIRPPRYV